MYIHPDARERLNSHERSDDEVWQLAYDEYCDHGDEDDGGGVALLAALGQQGLLLTSTAQCYYETSVEDRERPERKDDTEQEVEDCLVDDQVQTVLAQLAVYGVQLHCPRAEVWHLKRDVFEEAWYVVDGGDDYDTDCRLLRRRLREVPRLVERLVNGAVAIDRDQDYEPDSHGLRDRRAWPHVRLHVRVDSLQVRYPVGALAKCLERLHEETRHEMHVVCNCERL